MSDSKHSNTDQKSAGDDLSAHSASWAPIDPRMQSSDDNNPDKIAFSSKVRIVAAMHPVLNLFVLSYDAIFKRSVVARITMLFVLIGIVIILMLN